MSSSLVNPNGRFFGDIAGTNLAYKVAWPYSAFMPKTDILLSGRGISS